MLQLFAPPTSLHFSVALIVNYCIKQNTLCKSPLRAMIYILSWTTKEHKNTFQATRFKVHENSRTFPKIQGLFKTVQTLQLQKKA